MLNINDFILYLPMKGDLTDYSLNGYSATNSGASLTTGRDGLSNSAYELADVSDRIEFSSSVGNAIATAINNACSVIYISKFNALSTDGLFRIHHQWNNVAGQFSFVTNAINGNGGYVNEFLPAGSSTGSDTNLISTSDNNAVDTNWNIIVETYTDNGANTDMKICKNNIEVLSGSYANIKTNSTLPYRIGALNGSNTAGNFGKITNFMVLDRVVSKLEQKYINKFGNRKRIA